MDAFNIGPYNRKGMADEKKHKAVFVWFPKQKLSMYCVAEAHIKNCSQVQKKWEVKYGYKTIYSSRSNSGNCGVAVLNNNTSDNKFYDTIVDSKGRYIVLDVECTLGFASGMITVVKQGQH